MDQKERFDRVARGGEADRAPFFPDISTWYQVARLGLGVEQPYFPGQFIPDDSPLTKMPFRPEAFSGPDAPALAARLAGLSYADIYREFGWGLPAHIYDWYDETLEDGAERIADTKLGHRSVTFRTPFGDLVRTYKLDAEGTWSEYGHMVKSLGDLEKVRALVERTIRKPQPCRVERFLKATEGFGTCDLVIFRSPFGKLIHEYMGFEAVVYALMDEEEAVLDFLEFQEYHDLELIRMAAAMPGPVVIISDHADENLISPPWYRKYCIPYYRKACEILHSAGKLVSTHLDGNFRSYFPFIKETGFDILDGCTPSPMFNYEPEELAAATRPEMACWCGVPSGLFTIGMEREKLGDFGERIVKAFDGRVFLNVGDILPPTGDFGAVVELGKRAGCGF